MRTYNGTLEFVDLGTGEWYLKTSTQTYRLIVHPTLAMTFNEGETISLKAELADGAVAGGTNNPLLFVDQVA